MERWRKRERDERKIGEIREIKKLQEKRPFELGYKHIILKDENSLCWHHF